uniref:Uncharacterized protein n=1 Tax=Arundo donax TaxID=35708 RepID=A0A0A9FZL4_ARUDO
MEASSANIEWATHTIQTTHLHLIDDMEGVAIYVILCHIVIVLRVLHESNLVTYFFIKEEAYGISDCFTIVGIRITVHIHDDRAVAYH